jgi:hypothetical protein
MSRAFIQKRLPFKPTDIGGCQLWLDAADATTVTGTTTVTQWRDKSVNGCLVISSGGSPSYTKTAALSLGCVSFNGTTDYLTLGNFTVLQPYTIFVIATLNSLSTSASYAFIAQSDDSGYPADGLGAAFFYYASGGTPYLMPWAGITGATASPPLYFSAGATYIYSAIFNSSSSGVGYNGNFTSGINPGTLGWKNLRLGANWPLNTKQSTNVAEVIFYNSSLSITQRQQVESYLAQKWGLRQQLPQGHPGTRGIVYPQTPLQNWVPWRYPSAFVPTSIGNCQLWLDASDTTTITIATGVSQWNDKSGNNRNVSQPTTANQPSYANNTITFNGSTYLTNLVSAGISAGNFTGYLVYKPTGAGGRALFVVDNNTNWIMIDTGQVAENSNGGGAYIATTISTTVPTIVAVTSATTYSLDGNAFSSISNGYSQGQSPTSINVGSGVSGGVLFSGSVYEVIVYSFVLSQPQQYQIQGYLAWKWGLQANLPANHPYKNSAPIGATNPGGVSRPVGLPVRSIACYPTPRPIGITGANSSNIVNGYYFYYFTSPTATAIINVPGKNITVFALGGGGGGGYFVGGGGGAGGLQTLTSALNGSYTVTVGNGGAGSTGPYSTGPPGSNGSNTTFVGGAVSITALGGGGGGTTFNVAGANGGCGGGAPYGNSSYGTGSQGYNGQPAPNGGLSGGGGGIGGAGGHGGLNKDGGYGYGGTAISTYLDGNQYGGGGGAGNNNPGNETGGFATSGGGAGALDSVLYGDVPSSYAKSGTANKGAGGGGGGNGSTTLNTGAAGGSGIVILSYVYP